MHAASLDQTSVACVRDIHEGFGVKGNEHRVFTPLPRAQWCALKWFCVAQDEPLCCGVTTMEVWRGIGYVIKK